MQKVPYKNLDGKLAPVNRFVAKQSLSSVLNSPTRVWCYVEGELGTNGFFCFYCSLALVLFLLNLYLSQNVFLTLNLLIFYNMHENKQR